MLASPGDISSYFFYWEENSLNRYFVFFKRSQVWTHLDNGSCPGQAIGVRTRLENGLSGFIPTKMISDKRISSPRDRVKVRDTWGYYRCQFIGRSAELNPMKAVYSRNM